jgi:hypothetical protein
MNRRDEVVVLGKPRNQVPGVAREADGDCRDRAGLDHHEERPAVEESPERRERFAQIDVLAAGARHHRGELSVRERRGERQHAGEDPGREQETGTSGLPSHFGGDEEDARPDHRAHDNHRGRVQSEAALELGV